MNEAAKNPLQSLDCSFEEYLKQQKAKEGMHTGADRFPDYVFGQDRELRKALDAIPHFKSLAQDICNTYVSREIQSLNMQAIAVTPEQYQNIYKIGRDCANRLGIGMPSIFIVDNVNMNAGTIAVDDMEPVIYLNSGLVERMTEGELRTVIGHECGHIHNKHGIYQLMANLLIQGGASMGIIKLAQSLVSLMTTAAQVALLRWSRAAEITCDRAGMICAADPMDAISCQAKFLSGALLGQQGQINVEALMAQLKQQTGTVVRYQELSADHPYGLRRIACLDTFRNSALLYSWLPEFQTSGSEPLTAERLESQCRELAAIRTSEDTSTAEKFAEAAMLIKMARGTNAVASGGVRSHARMCCGMCYSCGNNTHCIN